MLTTRPQKHVHALLVERAEAAASRILDLEKEVIDLEDEISSQESELNHLRLELRAIETLVNEFLPTAEAADPELVRSIENWKADWKKLRERMMVGKSERGSSSRKGRSNGTPARDREGHEEGLRNGEEGGAMNGKARGYQHGHEHVLEHGHEPNHYEHEYEHQKNGGDTHERRYDLSVVEEVTEKEESLKNGHQHHHHQSRQGHHHHQHQSSQNGNGLGSIGSGDGQEDHQSAPPAAHTSAVRVSRTGA